LKLPNNFLRRKYFLASYEGAYLVSFNDMSAIPNKKNIKTHHFEQRKRKILSGENFQASIVILSANIERKQSRSEISG
jgi:hypothetical protein